MSFDILFRRGGHARRDLAVNRHVMDSHFLNGSNQRARFSGVTLQDSFSFERGDVLHHRRLTGESKVALDLARARRDSFVALLSLDEIEDASLSISQHELSIGASVRQCKFK
jgi:hypothetical protein